MSSLVHLIWARPSSSNTISSPGSLSERNPINSARPCSRGSMAMTSSRATCPRRPRAASTRWTNASRSMWICSRSADVEVVIPLLDCGALQGCHAPEHQSASARPATLGEPLGYPAPSPHRDRRCLGPAWLWTRCCEVVEDSAVLEPHTIVEEPTKLLGQRSRTVTCVRSLASIQSKWMRASQGIMVIDCVDLLQPPQQIAELLPPGFKERRKS